METKQQHFLLVEIGRWATSVWPRSCRVAKQVAAVCLSITLQEKSHFARLIKHEVTECEKVCCMGSHGRKSSREQISSQERQFKEKKKVSRQREFRQQRQVRTLEVEADWKIRESEMRTTALLDKQRRGIINLATYKLVMQENNAANAAQNLKQQ